MVDTLYVPLSHLVRWEPAKAVVEQQGTNPLGVVVALFALVAVLVVMMIFVRKK